MASFNAWDASRVKLGRVAPDLMLSITQAILSDLADTPAYPYSHWTGESRMDLFNSITVIPYGIDGDFGLYPAGSTEPWEHVVAGIPPETC